MSGTARPNIGTLHAALGRRWPRVFCTPCRPLKLRIHADILADAGFVAEHGLTPRDVGTALSFWCQATGYLRTIIEGRARFDLDGREAGTVTASEQSGAAERLQRKQAKAKARASARGDRTPRPTPTAAKTGPASLADLRAAARARRKEPP